VLRDPIERENTLLAASEAPGSASKLLTASGLPPDVARIATKQARVMGPRLPGGEVYTDDRAPVEWLIDRSFLGYAADE
jgi:hypothetical protein